MNNNLQLDFGFGGPASGSSEVFLLLSIQHEYYVQIKNGSKKYEYRRIFRNDPTTTFLYVASPYQTVSALATFGQPFVGSVEAISKLAEEQRKGGGESITRYMAGLTRGYAVPIESFEEIEPVTLKELRDRFPEFTPPQSYIVLNNYPNLLSFLLSRPRLIRP